MINVVNPGTFYQHYKYPNDDIQGRYRVKGLAIHTTTDELLVIYVSVQTGDWFARPRSEWFDPVENSDGQKTTRFRELR